MKVTEAKREANRRNAQKSTGPRKFGAGVDSETLGFMALGISIIDQSDCLEENIEILERQYKPEGPLEDFLVERIATLMMRARRAEVLEAEYITGEVTSPKFMRTMHEAEIDKFAEKAGVEVAWGFHPRLGQPEVEHLTDTFQRYETAIENKLYRAVHELERLQRIRRGEQVPAPAALEVGVSSNREEEQRAKIV